MSGVRIAIYDLLNADATLESISNGIFHRQAPSDTDLPYAIYQRMGGTSMWAFQGTTIDRDAWLVKGVGSTGQAEDISERVAEILDNAKLPIAGEMFLRKESVVDYTERVAGDLIIHTGNIYRVHTEAQ